MSLSIKRNEIIAYLNEMAPEELAESWDNSGLLLAGEAEEVEGVLLCLDVTEQVVETAIQKKASLIISHHPLIFSAIKRISVHERTGSLVYRLIQHKIDVYSAHTNVDKTYGGLNDILAGIIGVEGIKEDEIFDDCEQTPYRIGKMPGAFSIQAFNEHVSMRLRQESFMVSDLSIKDPGLPTHKIIQKVAVMCGSFDIPISLLQKQGIDAVVCGELKHNQVLALIGEGIHVISAGHHGSEHFFITLIQKWLVEKFPTLTVHCAGFDSYPLYVFNSTSENGSDNK